MNHNLSWALMAGGIVLAVFGINAMNSFNSDVSRFFTGAPTNKAVWMLVGGATAFVAGLTMMMRRKKS